MGLVHLPSLYDYWKKDPYFHYNYAYCEKNNMIDFLRYIDVCTSSTTPNLNLLQVKIMTI